MPSHPFGTTKTRPHRAVPPRVARACISFRNVHLSPGQTTTCVLHCTVRPEHDYRKRLASRSDSSRTRMSFSRTGSKVQASADRTGPSPSFPVPPRWAGACSEPQKKPAESNVPGPLTFRMMERVWSSMNSTRTWVTPPREPGHQSFRVSKRLQKPLLQPRTPSQPSQHRGSTNPRRRREIRRGMCIPVRPSTRVTLTSLTGTFAESIFDYARRRS